MPDMPTIATQDRARADSVEFPVTLANHAPMINVALARMGAGPARIEAWYRHYHALKRIPLPPAPVSPITPGTWQEHFGDRTREADYREFFAAEVARLGAGEAVRRYLPRLLPGIGGSGLHPLMRLAYAILNADDAEIAVSLAYWATCYLPLRSDLSAQPTTADPLAVLARIGDIAGSRTYTVEAKLLWHHIRAVGHLDGFAPVAAWLAIDAETLPRMAGAGLNLYAATMDFAALHIVTGVHWCRVVMPFLDAPEALLRWFWQAVAAMVPRLGFPEPLSTAQLEALRRLPAPDWPEIHAAAVEASDEHDISIAFSAFEEDKAYPDPLYRLVAARRLQLIA